MNFLYVTADKIGDGSGGGSVTEHELKAMNALYKPSCPSECISRNELASIKSSSPEPWCWDERAYGLLPHSDGGLAHFYAGTFPRTVHDLKSRGWKICYTIAAHDREESRAEHIQFGIDFDKLYPHLAGGHLWDRYIQGYAEADVIVCPGKAAERAVRKYGGVFATKRIEIIPHGCYLPECNTCDGAREVPAYGGGYSDFCGTCAGSGVQPPKPLPKTFTCGYMGSFGCDKGVIYLLQAWKKLAYKDAVLVLAGQDSDSPWVRKMAEEHGGGNIVFRGWVKKVSDFYNSLSLYVQPSVTEGFGLEVCEALSYGRPVICSEGAGAADLVHRMLRFRPRNVDELCGAIEICRDAKVDQDSAREVAAKYTWDKIRQRYVDLWKEMIDGQ